MMKFGRFTCLHLLRAVFNRVCLDLTVVIGLCTFRPLIFDSISLNTPAAQPTAFGQPAAAPSGGLFGARKYIRELFLLF